MVSHHRPIECVAGFGKSEGERFKVGMEGEGRCVYAFEKQHSNTNFDCPHLYANDMLLCTSPIFSPMKCEMNRNNFYLNVK